MEAKRAAEFDQLVQSLLWSRPVLPDKETFLSGFSSLTQEKADAVYDCYRQAFHSAKSYAQAATSTLCEEYQLEEKLALLEELESSQSDTTQLSAAVKKGPAIEAAHCRCLAKEEDLTELDDILQEAQEQRTVAQEQLAQRQKEVAERVDNIKGIAAQMSQVHEASIDWNARPTLNAQ